MKSADRRSQKRLIVELAPLGIRAARVGGARTTPRRIGSRSRLARSSSVRDRDPNLSGQRRWAMEPWRSVAAQRNRRIVGSAIGCLSKIGAADRRTRVSAAIPEALRIKAHRGGFRSGRTNSADRRPRIRRIVELRPLTHPGHAPVRLLCRHHSGRRLLRRPGGAGSRVMTGAARRRAPRRFRRSGFGAGTGWRGVRRRRTGRPTNLVGAGRRGAEFYRRVSAWSTDATPEPFIEMYRNRKQ